MKSPTDEEINRTLDRLSRPRIEIVSTEWQSDAEREGLPTVNIHDVRGAKVLDVHAVVRGSYPNHARRK